MESHEMAQPSSSAQWVDDPTSGVMMDSQSSPMVRFALFTPTIRWCIEIVYGATAAASIIGNMIVIIVLLFTDGFAKETRLFLINLAVSDVLMAVS